MSGFGKIAGSSASGGGNHFRDGNYVVLVEEVSLEKKYTGETFIAECRIMKAEANGELDEKGQPVVPNKVGSTASLVCLLQKHDSAASNAKAFALGVLGGLGYTEEQITEQVMVEVCDKRVQPLRGMAVEVRTRRKINQGKSNPANAGKVLTLPMWYSIAQTPEDIKAQRAWLDANKPGIAAAAAPSTAPGIQTTTAPVAPAAPPAAPAPVAPVAPTATAPALGGTLGALLAGS